MKPTPVDYNPKSEKTDKSTKVYCILYCRNKGFLFDPRNLYFTGDVNNSYNLQVFPEEEVIKQAGLVRKLNILDKDNVLCIAYVPNHLVKKLYTSHGFVKFTNYEDITRIAMRMMVISENKEVQEKG